MGTINVFDHVMWFIWAPNDNVSFGRVTLGECESVRWFLLRLCDRIVWKCQMIPSQIMWQNFIMT